MDSARHNRNQVNALSSIGWRRGSGRGGTSCGAAPLLLPAPQPSRQADGPLPTPASRGEEEKAQCKTLAEISNIFMDNNSSRRPARRNTRSTFSLRPNRAGFISGSVILIPASSKTPRVLSLRNQPVSCHPRQSPARASGRTADTSRRKLSRPQSRREHRI
jgi:hypothetical protein